MTSKEALNEMSRYIGELGGGETLEEEYIIERDLEILDEIRKSFSLIDYGKGYANRYALKDNLTNIIYNIDEEHYNKFKRWLSND